MPIQNTYYLVEQPCRAWVLVGNVESNTWVGNSQALDNVYAEVELQPGDEVQDLIGGTFLVAPDCHIRPVTLSEPFNRHVFLKYGGPKPQAVPADVAETALRRIAQHEATRPDSYRAASERVSVRDVVPFDNSAENTARVLRDASLLDTYAPDLAPRLRDAEPVARGPGF